MTVGAWWRCVVVGTAMTMGLATFARAQGAQGAQDAQDAQPLVRIEVQGKQPVLVGQQVKVDVTVLAPNFFTSPPPFPTLDVPGAIVNMPDEHSALGTEQINGVTYASVQKSYVFTAEQAGDFALPRPRIEFTFGGDDGKSKQGSATFPAARISVIAPAGSSAGPTAPGVPVAALRIRQSLDRDTTDLKAGDALVRTVDIFAAQTQAMMIPPVHFEAPGNVRVFIADPVLTDETKDRAGFLGGHRIERATYVFERPGRYTLPAIEVHWIDPTTRKPATTQAPAVTVRVGEAARNDGAIKPEAIGAAAAAAPVRRVDWIWVTAAFGALAVLTWLLRWARKRMPHWQARRDARRAADAVSDDAMFRKVLDACQRSDAQHLHAALLAWCAAHARTTPRCWAAELQDAALAVQVDTLERRLYRSGEPPGTPWGGSEGMSILRSAHRQWQARRATRSGRFVNEHGLGPLNPFEKQA